MARALGPTPSASKAWNAFGPSWMPAPISPSAGAFSSTMTLLPARASPRAALKPPIPPPAIRIGLLSLPFLIRCLRDRFFSAKDQAGAPRSGMELEPVSMTFDHHAMVQPAVPLPGGERSDRACAIRGRGVSFTSSSPLTRNVRATRAHSDLSTQPGLARVAQCSAQVGQARLAAGRGGPAWAVSAKHALACVRVYLLLIYRRLMCLAHSCGFYLV